MKRLMIVGLVTLLGIVSCVVFTLLGSGPTENQDKPLIAIEDSTSTFQSVTVEPTANAVCTQLGTLLNKEATVLTIKGADEIVVLVNEKPQRPTLRIDQILYPGKANEVREFVSRSLPAPEGGSIVFSYGLPNGTWIHFVINTCDGEYYYFTVFSQSEPTKQFSI